MFSYLDEIMQNQPKSEYRTKTEKLREFISNKDRKGLVVETANLIDNIDQDLSDEMIEMEVDSIKTKLRSDDEKLGINEPEEIPTLNENIIRGESPDEHYEKVRSKIRSALEEAQDALAHRVKEKYGNDAGFNEYQRNKDEFEKYGTGSNPSREFEAEPYSNVEQRFSVDFTGAEELLRQRSVNKKENTLTQRSQHRLRRGYD
jgi:hypothetical protein